MTQFFAFEKYYQNENVIYTKSDMLMYVLGVCLLTDNVALNKPAYNQYPYIPDNRFDAINAVDGRKFDLKWDGGQCAVSLYQQTAIWWVNLSSIHSIHHITIYFRTDNAGIVTVIVYIANNSHCCFKYASCIYALYLYDTDLVLSVY